MKRNPSISDTVMVGVASAAVLVPFGFLASLAVAFLASAAMAWSEPSGRSRQARS